MITILPGLESPKEENKNSLERKSSIPISEVHKEPLVPSSAQPVQSGNQSPELTQLANPEENIESQQDNNTSTKKTRDYTSEPKFIDNFQNRCNLIEQHLKEIQTKLIAEASSEYGRLRDRNSELERENNQYQRDIKLLLQFTEMLLTDTKGTKQNREKYEQIKAQLIAKPSKQHQPQQQTVHLQQQQQQHIQPNIQHRNNNINYYQPNTGYDQSQTEVPLSFRHESVNQSASVHFSPSVSQYPQPPRQGQTQVRPSVPPQGFTVPISVSNPGPPPNSNPQWDASIRGYPAYSNGFSGSQHGNQYHQVSGNPPTQPQSGNPHQQYYKQTNTAFSHQP